MGNFSPDFGTAPVTSLIAPETRPLKIMLTEVDLNVTEDFTGEVVSALLGTVSRHGGWHFVQLLKRPQNSVFGVRVHG